MGDRSAPDDPKQITPRMYSFPYSCHRPSKVRHTHYFSLRVLLYFGVVVVLQYRIGVVRSHVATIVFVLCSPLFNFFPSASFLLLDNGLLIDGSGVGAIKRLSPWLQVKQTEFDLRRKSTSRVQSVSSIVPRVV